MRRSFFIVAGLLLFTSSLLAQENNNAAEEKDQTARLTLQVLSAPGREPIPDAHIVVRFTEERMLRRDKRSSWETKTNRNGVAVLAGIPTGPVKVQVIARGYQTYGDQHELRNPEEEITVVLEPPQGQVSAY
jgi:hypothetical protein